MEYLGNDNYKITNKNSGQTKIVSSKELPSYGIHLPNSSPLPETHKDSFLEKSSEYAPAALGIAGAIGGSFIEPGLGTAAGGGIGQALGEWMKETIKHQYINTSEIGRQFAEGAIYGAIPEAKGGVALKFAKRASSGFAISAGVQAIEETKKQDTWEKRAERMVKQGAQGAVAFPLIGGGLDMGTSAMRFLGKRIPEDIYNYVIKKPQELLNTIHETVQGMLVGHDNVEYAISNGIIPRGSGITTEIINKSLDKGRIKAKEVEEKLQGLLKKNDTAVSVKEVFNMIEQVRSQISSHIRGSSLVNRLYSIAADNQVGKGKMANISLSGINEMKRLIGESYSAQGMPELYNTFQKFVEQQSGISEEVINVNKEAGKLVHINSLLKSWKGKEGAIPLEYRPQQIEKTIREAAKKNPNSLNSLINLISLGGLGVIGGTVKSLIGGSGGILGGMAVMFGLRSTIKSLIESSLESPESKLKAAGILSSMFKNTKNFAEKTQIAKALEQMGMRKAHLIMQGK